MRRATSSIFGVLLLAVVLSAVGLLFLSLSMPLAQPSATSQAPPLTQSTRAYAETATGTNGAPPSSTRVSNPLWSADSWITYTNSGSGFSFRYPLSAPMQVRWGRRGQQLPVLYVTLNILTGTPEPNVGGASGAWFEMVVYTNTDNLPLEDFMAQLDPQIQSLPAGEDPIEQELQSAGAERARAYHLDGPTRAYAVAAEGRVYWITEGLESASDTQSQLYGLWLGTLRFSHP